MLSFFQASTCSVRAAGILRVGAEHPLFNIVERGILIRIKRWKKVFKVMP
jgi:hypothetical protein